MGVTLDSISCFRRNWRVKLPVAHTLIVFPVHTGGKGGENIFFDKMTTVSVSTSGIGDDEEGWMPWIYFKQTEMAVLHRVLLLWQLEP